MASNQSVISCAVLPTGRQISYSIQESQPTGPWIILSNTFGADVTLFEPVAQRLASSGFRVLSYDHPGHGQSSPVNNVDKVEMEEMVDDLDQLLRVLEIDNVRAWVGVSLGAASGVYLSCRRPKLIERLVFCGCPPASFAALGLMVPGQFDKIRADAEQDGTTAKVIRQMHYGWASKEWLELHPDQDARLIRASETLSLDGLRAVMTLQKSVRFDMRPLVGELVTSCERIMFVRGEHDTRINPFLDMMRDKTIEIAKERGIQSDFSIVTVPGTGHVMYLQNESYFCNLIKEFSS